MVARDRQPSPRIYAHRGWSAKFPENTMLAFEEAFSLPIAGLELDLQWTRDQVTVSFHDRTLYKVGGGRVALRNRNWETLRHLDLGSWFDPDYGHLRMPLLTDILDRLGHRGQLLLEVKRRELRNRDRLQGLMADVLGQVIARGLEASTAILCFDFDILKWAHEQAPQIPKILNQTRPKIMAGDDFLYAYDVRTAALTHDFVKQVHNREKKVFTYTVNRHRDLKRMLAYGVDGIITDRPEWALSALGQGVNE